MATGSTGLTPAPTALGPWGWVALIQEPPVLREPMERKASDSIKNMDCKLLTRILGNYIIIIQPSQAKQIDAQSKPQQVHAGSQDSAEEVQDKLELHTAVANKEGAFFELKSLFNRTHPRRKQSAESFGLISPGW